MPFYSILLSFNPQLHITVLEVRRLTPVIRRIPSHEVKNRYFSRGKNKKTMNIQTERAAVVSQLEQVEDLELILAVKHLLGYGLKKQKTGSAFTAALKRAVEQSERGEGRSHESVKRDFHNRYST